MSNPRVPPGPTAAANPTANPTADDTPKRLSQQESWKRREAARKRYKAQLISQNLELPHFELAGGMDDPYKNDEEALNKDGGGTIALVDADKESFPIYGFYKHNLDTKKLDEDKGLFDPKFKFHIYYSADGVRPISDHLDWGPHSSDRGRSEMMWGATFDFVLGELGAESIKFMLPEKGLNNVRNGHEKVKMWLDLCEKKKVPVDLSHPGVQLFLTQISLKERDEILSRAKNLEKFRAINNDQKKMIESTIYDSKKLQTYYSNLQKGNKLQGLDDNDKKANFINEINKDHAVHDRPKSSAEKVVEISKQLEEMEKRIATVKEIQARFKAGFDFEGQLLGKDSKISETRLNNIEKTSLDTDGLLRRTKIYKELEKERQDLQLRVEATKEALGQIPRTPSSQSQAPVDKRIESINKRINEIEPALGKSEKDLKAMREWEGDDPNKPNRKAAIDMKRELLKSESNKLTP